MKHAYSQRISLPNEEWYKCKQCNGKGLVHMQGDLHRSTRLVPCPKDGCVKGTIKYRVLYSDAPFKRERKR